MTKLLKGKHVFLDTTEFSHVRFDVGNPAFTEFRRLCRKRQFVLLTTDITKREVEAGMKILISGVVFTGREMQG